MHKVIHSENIKQSLQARGWKQKDLAEALGVSAQSVTNWLKGSDFPRPDKLLKLATTLQLGFDKLVKTDTAGQPVVAFRKKAGTKTTDAHIDKAMVMGALLKALVPFLPTMPALRLQLSAASTDYEPLQAVVSQARARLGLGEEAAVAYQDLIGEFAANAAVVAPVLWGQKQNHKNALHILLPQEKVAFIFLNLDTHLEDFKFWMAHELAHVYTPDLAGKDEGEDFADAFAGALLFPRAVARKTYERAISGNKSAEGNVLSDQAKAYEISLFSVFSEVNRYAHSQGLPPLRHTAEQIHAMRQIQRGKTVSEMLFAPVPAEPGAYIAATKSAFKSAFFESLQRMIKINETGTGYIQQVMDIPMQDAMALHGELIR
jgi:transcriptional regulator with XRE-family HTH domain/Zn-dependent peptidase ImmA (M78 family)